MDKLRLQVEPLGNESGGGFEVQIFVNEVEMTRAGAGIGMDTNDLLVPSNRFRPQNEPHRVPVARCDCGVYGCGATDVVITRDDDVVHWDWQIETPMNRRATFRSHEYLAEIDRFEDDRSWETSERTAVRLIAPGASSQLLRTQGLEYAWAADWHEDTELFVVTFTFDRSYQVFVWFAWDGHTPKSLAAEVAETLQDPPATWDATWHGITPEARNLPPSIAGPNWTRHKIWGPKSGTTGCGDVRARSAPLTFPLVA